MNTPLMPDHPVQPLDAKKLEAMIARAVAQPQVGTSAQVIPFTPARRALFGGGLAALAASIILAINLAPLSPTGTGISTAESDDLTFISQSLLTDSL